jgi:hypothetical protein
MMPKSGATFLAESDGVWIVFKIFVFGNHVEMQVKSPTTPGTVFSLDQTIVQRAIFWPQT